MAKALSWDTYNFDSFLFYDSFGAESVISNAWHYSGIMGKEFNIETA